MQSSDGWLDEAAILSIRRANMGIRKVLAAAAAIGAMTVGYFTCQPQALQANDDTPPRQQTTDAVLPASERYRERHRPQYHFTPEHGDLADPNGLVFHDGEYHLFHQQNGRWAHAVSLDLLHWKHLPIALEHDNLGQALSGSVVVDRDDSSGFFDGGSGLVAIYTSTAGGEQQSIAYSRDNGRHWVRHEGNPVIRNEGRRDFRDPKVFWHEGSGRWIMAVSTDQSVTLYGSPDLKQWQWLSRFGDGQGLHAAVWECPDLFPLAVDGDPGNIKWVLHVSVGDNRETRGSTAQYFVGEFDGTTFTNDNPPQTVLVTDHGQDFYAAQSWFGIPAADGRRIWIAWMSNWRYPYQTPTHPWHGAMTLPRQLSLKTVDGSIRLVQQPVDEVAALRGTEVTVAPFTVEGSHEVSEFQGTTYEFELEMSWQDVRELGIRVRGSESMTQQTAIGVDVPSQKIFVDRTHAGLKEVPDRSGGSFAFGSRRSADYPVERKRVKLHGFVDESSLEVFVNDGEQVFSNLIFTHPDNRSIELYADGGRARVESLRFRPLRRVWGGSMRAAAAEGAIMG
ncbi:glycoside hydrolase family 32 protein [Marilutibacter chinensis]|uniref:Glycoside hydrolase family 32 protein n=1 Tax=Marilutibacter chinensis TaxID=2912247 RepID=A0ABS9HWP2_9GAMM|nr:glycoside hydrolase family 32 protein [Lysobacter chinensis]MCF7222792.1 glycoside hydrolase family 32 protein [Lysobacter chinensis]